MRGPRGTQPYPAPHKDRVKSEPFLFNIIETIPNRCKISCFERHLPKTLDAPKKGRPQWLAPDQVTAQLCPPGDRLLCQPPTPTHSNLPREGPGQASLPASSLPAWSGVKLSLPGPSLPTASPVFPGGPAEQKNQWPWEKRQVLSMCWKINKPRGEKERACGSMSG